MYDTISAVYNSNKELVLFDFKIDFQNFDRIRNYSGTNIKLDLDKRIFCPLEDLITYGGYFLVKGKFYKIMKLYRYSNYIECWLYECNGGINEK